MFHSRRPTASAPMPAALRAGSAARHWQGTASRSACSTPRPISRAAARRAGQRNRQAADRRRAGRLGHPGRGGRVQLGPKMIIAWFGELHPALLAELGLDRPGRRLRDRSRRAARAAPKPTRDQAAAALSDLMPLSRDFAFVVDREVPAANALRARAGGRQGADHRRIGLRYVRGQGMSDRARNRSPSRSRCSRAKRP